MKIGVIGVGNMGRHHVRLYKELGVLCCISDINGELAKQVSEKYGCNYYEDYNEMLNNEKLDAVSVAVPTSLHKKVSIDVISKGVNLLIEKPIAENLKDAKDIIDAAKERGLKLMVGHVERFNPAVQRLKKILDEGKLGKVTSVVAKRVGLFPSQVRDANIIIDLAVHDIDVMNFLFGSCGKIVGSSGGVALDAGREDYAHIMLDYNGIGNFIQVNWITPIKIRQLSITGTKGHAELNYLTQELVLYETNYEKEFDNYGDFIVKFGVPAKIRMEFPHEEPLKNELKEFISCLKENRQPQVDPENAFNVLSLAIDALGKIRGYTL
ncbi:Gfo/Idh/MocA family oxidoreductase [Candidatus Woesearchaeota archaeon]|nr:Gfo/Idh/MocA family oxidoreductase [Candidatus Woesearchaeota archaeon]